MEGAAPEAGKIRPRAPDLPSAPVVGFRQRESVCQRVLAGQDPECDRDLAAARDTELLSQSITVRFRSSRGDTELDPDLVVREAQGDELDHLPLTGSDQCRFEECLHGARV